MSSAVRELQVSDCFDQGFYRKVKWLLKLFTTATLKRSKPGEEFWL